mgnify:CR=1 FL=1
MSLLKVLVKASLTYKEAKVFDEALKWFYSHKILFWLGLKYLERRILRNFLKKEAGVFQELFILDLDVENKDGIGSWFLKKSVEIT